MAKINLPFGPNWEIKSHRPGAPAREGAEQYAFGPLKLKRRTPAPPSLPPRASLNREGTAPDDRDRNGVNSQHSDPAYSAIKSLDELDAAVEGLEQKASASGLAGDVMSHVRQELKYADRVGKTPVILLGEIHGHAGDAAVQIACMQAVRTHTGGQATFMVELTPQDARAEEKRWVKTFSGAIPSHDATAEEVAEADRLITEYMCRKGSGCASAYQFAAKAYTAHVLDMDVEGFDLKKKSPLSVREEAMAEAILKRAKDTRAPVIVQTGFAHIPELRDRLHGDTHVIAVSISNTTTRQRSRWR